MENIIGFEVKEFDYSKINGETYHLKVVGAKVKEGADGEYLLVSSRSTEDNSMPSVRSNLATEWRLAQFLRAVGLKKLGSLKDLIGKEFDATLIVHPYNSTNFIDINQYV